MARLFGAGSVASKVGGVVVLAKIRCQRCGWRYNPELLDTCPLCEVRQETAPEAEDMEAQETVGGIPTDGESYLPEAGPKDEFVHLKVGDSSSGDSLPSDAEDSPLLRKIIEQNEAQLAQLKAIRKSSKSSETYLLFLAVVYPILGIVGIFFIYLANA